MENKKTNLKSDIFRKYEKTESNRLCIVIGCVNYRKNDPSEAQCFELPANKKKAQLWLKLVGRKELIGSVNDFCTFRVCELHFDENDILRHDSSYLKTTILKPGAVPNLQLPVFAHIMSLYKSVDTSDNSSQSRSKVGLNLIQFQEICDSLLSPDLAKIIKAQIFLKKKDGSEVKPEPAIKRSTEYTRFCVLLFHTSPQAYLMLQNVIGLPPIKSIIKVPVPVSSLLNEDVLSILKIKVDKMTEKQKNCALLIGVKELKTNLYYNITADRIVGMSEINGVQRLKPASYVVILIAQGIVSNWMQPIAFSLPSICQSFEDIAEWIRSVITKLIDIGLKVRAIVSDPDNDFFITEERPILDDPFFEIRGKKVYIFYDISLLIRTAHRYLLTHDFFFEDSYTARLEDLIQLYELDKTKNVKLAKQLKQEHIDPDNFDKLTTQDATKVFSKEVGIAIATYVHFKAISESGMGTAQLILFINKLRETLMQKKLYASDVYLTFLMKMINLFNSLKLVTKNGSVIEYVPFKNAFEITIRSTFLLEEDLKAEGHLYLLMKNLQLDSALLIFKKIQKKIGKGKPKLTSMNFINGFRSIYFSRLKKQPIVSNKVEDFRKIIHHLTEVAAVYDTMVKSNPIEKPALFKEVKCEDYNQSNIKEGDSLFNICGHLLHQCRIKHNDCKQFEFYMNRLISKLKSLQQLCSSKDNDKSQWDLLKDSYGGFYFFIEQLERIFVCSFEKSYINIFKQKQEKYIANPIAFSMYQLMEHLHVRPMPCPCFPTAYVKKLFIRLRIYFTIKHNNKRLRRNQNISIQRHK